jgi:hypothetical protein
MSAAVNTIEKDIFGKDFTVGTFVNVKCKVIAITPAPPGYNTDPTYLGGSGDLVTCQVEVNGNAGEVSPGPTFQVSPVQCRAAGSTQQG